MPDAKEKPLIKKITAAILVKEDEIVQGFQAKHPEIDEENVPFLMARKAPLETAKFMAWMWLYMPLSLIELISTGTLEADQLIKNTKN